MQDVLKGMIGFKSGSLAVVCRAGTLVTPNGTKQTIWKCKCKCGRFVSVRASDLRRKDGKATKTCRRCAPRKHGHTRPGWQSITYQAWHSMIQRCRRCIDYRDRGITVCKRWLVFSNFLADVGKRPSRKHTLDRINNDLGYRPGNVRWATMKVQNRNKRSNVFIVVGNKRMILTDALRVIGMSTGTYYSRIGRGMGQFEAMTTPIPQPKTALHRMRLSWSQQKALNEKQKNEVKFLRSKGYTIVKLAKFFGVCHGTIERACK